MRGIVFKALKATVTFVISVSQYGLKSNVQKERSKQSLPKVSLK